MALSSCPECKKSVSSKANSCPHCGFVPKRKGCSSTLVWGFLIVFVLIVLAAMCSDNSDYKKKEYTPTGLDALRHAQTKLKPLLKSPSTAEFPSYREKIKHYSGCCGEFKIDSWVDSQNGFGATIRTYYTCTVYYTDDDMVGIRDLKIKD